MAPTSESQGTSVAAEQRLQMSYEEYLAWTDDTVHAEWVHGEVLVFMPPKPRHQDIVGFLCSLLGLFVQTLRLGKVLIAPLEMRALPDGPAREPDVLFVASEHLERFTETRLSGPADLVIEVISDESVARDRAEKFYEYQTAGIREYWLIDPRPGYERADFYVLDDSGRYRPVPIDPDGRYHSTLLSEFWLPVDEVLAAELPEVLPMLARIMGPQKLLEALGLPHPQGSMSQ